MRDALKNYLTLASGLTEVGRQRAIAASKALVAQGEATAEQVGGLADDLIQTSKTNRDMITTLVRTEVERAMAALGVATADSVEYLTKRLQSLEAALRDASEAGGEGGGAAVATGAAASGAAASGAKAGGTKAGGAAAKPAKAAKKAAKGGAGGGAGGAGGDVTSTHELAGPAKKAAAKTAKAAPAAASPAKPAKKAAGKAGPAKKPAKKAQS